MTDDSRREFSGAVNQSDHPARPALEREAIAQALQESIAQYNCTIELSEQDDALSEGGRRLIINGCLAGKSAIEVFARKLLDKAPAPLPSGGAREALEAVVTVSKSGADTISFLTELHRVAKLCAAALTSSSDLQAARKRTGPRDWTPGQFWEHVAGLTGDFERDQMRDMMTERGLMIVAAPLPSANRVAACQLCGEVAPLRCGPSRFGAETWACDACWNPDGASHTPSAERVPDVEMERLRAVAWAAQGVLNADTYVSDVPREQAVREANQKLRQALGTWQMHHTAASAISSTQRESE